jgi:hypothetical protein
MTNDMRNRMGISNWATGLEDDNFSNLAELSNGFFGEHKVISGKVFFGSKKGAKKSAAVAMLRELPDVELNKPLAET